MSATNTPLRLNNYFFPVVQVIANPKYENAEEQPEPRFRITPSIAKNDENGLYQVSVDFRRMKKFLFHIRFILLPSAFLKCIPNGLNRKNCCSLTARQFFTLRPENSFLYT
jgi:hypothetical protein